MLTNKWFIAVVVTLLVGAVGYNVWYFFLSEDEPRPAAERVAGSTAATGGTGGGAAEGGGPPGTAGRDTAPGGGASSLAAALANGRPALRGERELPAVLEGRPGPGDWGRDPLSRVSTAEGGGEPRPRPASPPPGWVVTAIVTGEGRRAAVIDGEVYREGDRLDGGTVAEIRVREVVVRWRGRLVTLPLKSR